MSYWANLPAPILLQVIYSLDIKSVLQVCLVCRHWSNFARSDAVWRRLFARRWKKQRESTRNKRQSTWMDEYKHLQSFFSFRRLKLEVDGEAWFLTFSRDGKKMAASTRAGSAFLWSVNREKTDAQDFSVVCSLEQRVSIDRGFECYVCSFSPNSRLLLLTAVDINVEATVHTAGTAFVFDSMSSMKLIGYVDKLVFYLTTSMAWIDDSSFFGCQWDAIEEIINVNVYSPLPVMTSRQLCSFDCGPSKAIKSVVHIRLYTLDGGKHYDLVAIVCPDRPDMSLHVLWRSKWSEKSLPPKLTFDISKSVDLNCLVCGMEMTPLYKRLVTVCTSVLTNTNASMRDVEVKVFDLETLTCLQCLPSCKLALRQWHLFVGVNEDYVAW